MMFAVSSSMLQAGEHSGIQELDHAAARWAKALGGQDAAAMSAAEQQVATTCKHLGIPVRGFVSSG